MVRVVCPVAVGLVVVVVTIGVVGLFESAAHTVAFHGVPFQTVLCRSDSSRVVREIVVVSVNFSWLQISLHIVFPSLGWSSLLPVGFQLEISFVQRRSWCLAIALACFRHILLWLRIHDVIPFTVNKTSAFWVARTLWSTPGSSSSFRSSGGTLLREELLSASWLHSSCSLGLVGWPRSCLPAVHCRVS